jgi:hypothetical protein
MMGSVSTQTERQELATWARMLADPTRATVCLALLDGRAWTANELARLAKASRPTISEHLWFGLGWSRHLPSASLAIIQPLVTDGALTVEELGRRLVPSPTAPDLGWNSTA